jgi:hypothetical protein
MEHRLGRTLRVFLIVLAAAGFHRLTVVPLVEPRVHDSAAAVEMSPEQAAAIRARADKRLAALGEIFPAGSWEREDPIVLESRQMRLLFRQYQALPDGRVHLVPCTLVVLPDRNRVAGEGDVGRTLVLRVPQGAVLEFDEPLDLRQGRLARLIGGSLRGQVTIRGTPSAPGAEDDIEIVTRDVELAELEVRTTEAVQFRYGRSTGSGRAMIARLLPRAEASENGPSIGGVDSIRLDRDVKLRLEGLQGGLLPGGATAATSAAAAPSVAAGQQTAGEPPPVFVSCRGGLSLNVSANVITFEERVEVVRTAADGATDQLDCEQLAIVLARREPSPEGQSGRAGLEPASIQAKGRPVVARSSGAGLEARAARLGYEVASRRILLDGEEPVSLVARDTEMEARSIDYVPGPGSGPGALMAVGPGTLRTRSGGGPPVLARWQKWLRMRPDGAGHVASIAGDAEVAVEAQGRLSGSEMHLWLDIDQSSSTPRGEPAGRAGPDLSGVRPSRLLARGMVEIEAEQLAARTDRMEVWFRNQPVASAPVAAAPAGAAVGAPVIPAQAARQPIGNAPPGAAPQPKPPTTGRIVATAALIRGLVTMGGQQGELEEMSLEGQVHVVEEGRTAGGGPAVARAPGSPEAEAGLEIRGDQMQLTRPTRFDARAIVSGRPAEVRGRGLDLSGPLVDFDRGRNRLTVDGAGRLQVPLAAGAGGLESFSFTGSGPQAPAPAASAAAPGALDVTWQGRMDFDGLTARFVDQVVTSARGSVVRAGSLDVVFNRPVEFTAARQQPPGLRPDVARIACGSGVKVESETTSQDGAKSMERLFVRDLVIDRTTGDVTGTGPGRLTSTRFGQAPAMALPAAGPAAPAAAPQPARPDELTFLGVDFQRGMRGNLERRVMEFHQRVEAIWGPVAGWNDTLDPRAPTGLPPRVVTISSDVLGVGQVPPAPGQRRGSIEIAAGGNVLVEGEAFTARSARLTWSEAKDLLVFEGDGRSDAQLFRQAKIGAATSSASAGKILYWRALNRVDVDDARFLDLDQLGAGAAGLKVPGPSMGPAGPAKPVSRPLPGT